MSSPLLQHRGGTGEPLVLLHGLGGSWRTWLPVLPALERHHDVLALDLPGFGGAPPLPRGVRPTAGALARAVEEVLEQEGLGPVHVAGNSLGGRVAIELAVRGRARSVVAISPSGLEGPPERAAVFWADQALRLRAKLARRLRPLSTRTALARTLSLGGPHVRPWRIPEAEAAHQVATIGESPSYQRTLLWAGMLDVPTRVRRVACPARVVVGSGDLLVIASAPRWALALPRADLVVLPGAGHLPMFDAPERVARAILGVTATHPSGAAPS